MASAGFGVRGHGDRGVEGASIEAPNAPSGVGYGDGCPLPSRLGGLGSVMSSPSEVRGGAPAAIAFSAYFWSQNTSGSKKNTILLLCRRCFLPLPAPPFCVIRSPRSGPSASMIRNRSHVSSGRRHSDLRVLQPVGC